MPRTARVAPKGYIYHVLTRGNNRQDVFREEADFKKYLTLLSHYKEKYQFKLYHYVLMTNHVHLVLEPSESGGRLSEIMKGINLSYVLYYKKKNHYSGHFWQDRFKSILISRDEYLLACGSYVELNPVRARMVDDPKNYPWSSYGVHAYGRKNDLVDEHPVYSLLSEEERHRQKNYREFVRGMLKAKDGMRGEMDRRMAYGGEDFLKKMAATHHIAELIRQRGRQKEWRKNK